MEERGDQTHMPRVGLRGTLWAGDSVIWSMAVFLAALFALGQVVTVLAAAPAVVAFHSQAGTVPGFVALLAAMGPLLIGGVLVALDAILLWACLWLAKRYWVGFAFIPPVLYLGIGSVLIWVLVSGVIGVAAPA